MNAPQSRYQRPDFGGTFDAEDEKRMRRNQEKVDAFLVTHNGRWFTPEEVREGAKLAAAAEVTARIRCTRTKGKVSKQWTVDCRKLQGAYRYRLRLTDPQGALFGETP